MNRVYENPYLYTKCKWSIAPGVTDSEKYFYLCR